MDADREFHDALFSPQQYDPFTFAYPGYLTIRRFADLAAERLTGVRRAADLGCGPGEITCELARRHPALITAEYRIAKRPRGRVLVDYNQNRWGSTLASVYSVRPLPEASVSTPVTWKEVERGVRIEEFSVRNVPARIAKMGDLWKPLLGARGRFNLAEYV